MADTIFLACTYGVLPAWVLLLVAPSWRWTQRIVHAPWPALLLGGIYALLLARLDGPEGGGFGTLTAVAKLLGSPQGALVGWVHYLVFDLFIGAWEVRDARRLGLHHGLCVPCLCLTLLLGPIGLGCYLALRLALRGRISLYS